MVEFVNNNDPNLKNLHKAMQYDSAGYPAVRTLVNNDWSDPVPVTLGSNTITIAGNVTVPTTVNVTSSPSNPLHVHVSEIGTSGILDVPWMPTYINGGNANVVIKSGNVTVQQGTTPWNIVGNVNVVSGTSNVTISNLGNASIQTSLADGGQLGPFSRLRTSTATNINEYKDLYGWEDQWNFDTVTGGAGTTVYNVNASTMSMTVGTGGSDYVIRQTKMYHRYTPGCGQLIMITGVLAATKPSLTQRVGYFDDYYGIYFERATNSGNATVNSWNIRNSNGGTPTVAQTAAQGSWNIDNFDGTGPSGVTINYNTAQIWFIDFQWLGVGRVRCGFNIDGHLYYAHEFLNSNSITSTYMGNPSLPVRYEIRNTGTTSGNSSMSAICAAVQTEGGTQQNVWRYSTTTGNVGVTCGNVSRGVMAIRLKNRIGPNNNIPNQTVAQLTDFSLFGSQPCHWQILLASNSTVIAGSPTWTSTDPTSYVEYTTDFALQNLSGNTLALLSGFVSTAQGSANGSASGQLSGTKSAINQNYDSTNSQIIILAAGRIGNQDSVVYAAMDWMELD